jgi:quinol-cytochrome oxidoreductase complex cytochrome b subunit
VSLLARVDQAVRRSAAWRSIFRNSYPNDERSRAYAVMNNVFLHLHPVRVRQHAVKFAYTFCLGGLSFFLFLVLTVTGVYLMFFYAPSATQAYSDILKIQTLIPFGQITRNIHRWGAHLMVFFVFLHMMRVFYPLLNTPSKLLLLGGLEVGQNTLLRFYVLHVMVFPLLAAVFLAVHFWRIRKDGGISGPL